MTISPFPTPPSRARPDTFADEADAFLGHLPAFQQEANDLADQLNSLAAPSFVATSATPLTVSAGIKQLVIDTGVDFGAGQSVSIALTAAPSATAMIGVVTAHNVGSGALSVAVPAEGVRGTGTGNAWTVSLAPGGGGAVGQAVYLAATQDAARIAMGVDPSGRYPSIRVATNSLVLDLSYKGALVLCTSGAPILITVPNLAWEVGTVIDIAQYGNGQVTIGAGAGATVSAMFGANKTAAHFAMASLVFVGSGWLLTGSVIP